MQQGRVQLDSDWNEQIDIQTHYERTALQDIIGKSGTVHGNDGFCIKPIGNSFSICKGHYYVDGILCENEQDVDVLNQPDLSLKQDQDQYLFSWDNVPGSENKKLEDFLRQNFKMDEPIEFTKNPDNNAISISQHGQPSISLSKEKPILTIDNQDVYEFIVKEENKKKNIYYKFNPVLPTDQSIYLAYIDVWERHMTGLDDPEIFESALGGADTTTRTKIVWQVKLLRVGNISEVMNYHCLSSFDSWDELVKESDGTLQARLTPVLQGDNPCASSQGQGRIGNQLYRVEIHDPGEAGKGATFKWSRDNGMVVTRLENINENENKLAVASAGKDKELCFEKGQWVEIIDDHHELWGIPGTLVQLTSVEERAFTFDINSVKGEPLTNENFAQVFNPKVRRWDSPGGCIDVPAENSGYIELEDGVEVKFGNGTYRINDYWLIPARTAKGKVEWPMNGDMPETLPPRIERHFCRLALLKYDDGSIEVIRDCRRFFPSTTALNGLSANTGIVDLTIKKDHGLRFGPFNHWLNDLSVPPAIILGLIRESNNNIDFNDGSESRHYIAENVSTESFWIRAPSPDTDEVNIKLRWWAVPAQDKGVQKGEPLPNITIIPQIIPIGNTATIRVIDPEANKDRLVKNIIEIKVEVFVLNPNGTNTALNYVIANVKETGPDKGIFEVGMDIEDRLIAIGDKEIMIPSSLNLEGNGGSVKVTYTPETGEPVSDTADIPSAYIPELASITVTSQGEEVASGDTLQFEAELIDQEGNPFPGTVTWSVKKGTTGSGEIDKNGVFKGTVVGPTTVVASVGSVEGTAPVVVTPGPLDKITILPDPGTGKVITKASGELIQFTARYEDAYGNEIENIHPTWKSSDVDKGTINAQGEFTAVHIGGTVITAVKDHIRSNVVTVRVTHGSPSKFACFAVQPDKGIETSTITAILKDTNNNPISGAKVNFSTDKGTFNPKSAKTDNDGVASTVLTCQDAMVEGVLKTAKVKAEYTNLTCRVAVNFTPKEAAITCSANPSSTTGSTSTITAILKDTNNNPIQGAKVNFSTDKGTLYPESATTLDNGVASTELTRTAYGTATVTVRYGNVEGEEVNVNFKEPCPSAGTPDKPCPTMGTPDKPCPTMGTADKPCPTAGTADKPCSIAGLPNKPCPKVHINPK
jgi:hypothetical protein